MSDAPLQPGLYIVATPIGNLGDITMRSADVLSRCDLVACEDTRVTGKLLKHLGLHKKMWRYDDHSDEAARERVIEAMRGQAVALVSDAGTPLISDPGYRLVRAVREAGLRAIPVPGACAAIAALSVAGLPSDRFAFEGFLPAKTAARRAGAAYVLRKPFTPGTLRGIMGAIEQDRLKGRKRPHVLVIDDSRTVRKVLVNSFKSADYRVSEAGSMEAAFADCDIAHVDLAVCDIFMPGMGGVQGMAMLKQAWPRIGVIAMSAGMDGQMTEAQALEAAARVGADSCIAKPFTAQVLLLRAESVLRAKQMAQKAGEPA